MTRRPPKTPPSKRSPPPGLRSALHDGHPRPGGCHVPVGRLLERARELGVPLVIDSDAHKPDEVGLVFDRAVQAARAAGYKATLRLSDRSFVPLP